MYDRNLILVYSVKDIYNRHLTDVKIYLTRSPDIVKYLKEPLLFEKKVKSEARKSYPEFDDSQLIVYFEHSIQNPLF